MENKNVLPTGWKWAKLGEVCDKISLNKIKIKQKDYLIEGRFPVVDQGQDLIGGYYNDDNLVIPNEPPYIVFGDHTKAKKFINFKFVAGADGVKVLKAKENIEPKFLYYSLFTIKIEDKGYARHFQLLEKELFPVPPKSIQLAIVSKIEELFSELDKGIEQLKTAQQQLKTYRQAVLKCAFEGKLTEEWRTAVRIRSAPHELSMAAEPEGAYGKESNMPEGWKVKLLKEICSIIGGVTKGQDFKRKETIHLPYLRVANVQDGYLDLRQIKTIEVLPTDKEKYKLLFGDILYTEGGDKDKLGRGTIWKNEVDDCIHQNHIFRARPKSQVYDSRYIAYYSQTKNAKRYFFKNGKQTTNLASINLTVLSNLPVPVCPIEEQIEIVNEIESRLSVAEKMEECINQGLQQAEALRQSILKKAFDGRLASNEVAETKASKTATPHERKVLAGKIIHLMHDGHHFGLTKFQKVLFLVENFSQIGYDTNYIQERAGPYDKSFTVAFRREMLEKNWFGEEQKNIITKFVPGENVGSLIVDYAKYFRSKGSKITFVIQQLMDKSTHDAELIATLYAVWNNRLIKKKSIKEKELVQDFFNWSPKKKDEFQDIEVVEMFKWMKKVKLMPVGFGKVV